MTNCQKSVVNANIVAAVDMLINIARCVPVKLPSVHTLEMLNNSPFLFPTPTIIYLLLSFPNFLYLYHSGYTLRYIPCIKTTNKMQHLL